MKKEDDAPITSLAMPNYGEQKAQLYGFYTNGGSGDMATFDPATPEGAALLIKATLEDAQDLQELANQQIDVAHFYICDASKTLEDGEVNEWKRVVLFDKDGKSYSCGSQGVLKSLYVMSCTRRSLPFDPPIKCTVKVTKTGNKRLWMYLLPDPKSMLGHAAKR